MQGVGFRPWVYCLAELLGLTGRIWNHAEGVTIQAHGDESALAALLEHLRHLPMPAASVRKLEAQPLDDPPPGDFQIIASRASTQRELSITPDVATCEQCERETLDPGDRRFGYAFTNCTRCGPRFTICDDSPYDRARTTMRAFPMCDECRREYENPRERRFHAQPVACPQCGPRVWLVDAAGRAVEGDAIGIAADRLLLGETVAVKGLGGFHLACDATNEATVQRLRSRKRREAKPLAVMVRDLAAAEDLAELSDAERRLLRDAARPIVLVRRRRECAISQAVAPGSATLGLILAYSPLHMLLLEAAGRPLVMTSGNLTDEPMATENAEALERLGRIADAFLLHDREIANRCDDSVARVIAGRPTIFRRSRGYVPSPILIQPAVSRPVLACGAHLKNTFCVARGEQAWFGPHIGDLETHEACAAFEESVERFERFVGVRPEIVAHDLHPDYFSTQYALRRSGVTHVGVQHHHAHVVSAMAEHGLTQPVLGLAWDGTGYGPADACRNGAATASAWGGELLLADFRGYQRLATLRPIPLAGGEQAIRQVWRLALAVLEDAFDGSPPLADLPLFARVPAMTVDCVRHLLRGRLHCPLAHGAGRYFDAIGALVLGLRESRFEGQVAMALEAAAASDAAEPYGFTLQGGELRVVDLRTAVRLITADVIAGRTAAFVSSRFHATLAAAAIEMIRDAARRVGRRPVVLTGGCFQNAVLSQAVQAGLAGEFEVYCHERVPPGDGGLALGQVLIADAIAKAEIRSGATECRCTRAATITTQSCLP